MRAALVLGAAGLLTMVLGTFLPWLRSGEVQRNSYASFGVLRRLIGFRGAVEVLLRCWPLFGAVCALVVVLAAAGLLRTAALLALVVAAWAGTVGGAALAREPAAGIRVARLGPIVTITGAIAVAAAAIVVLISRAWVGRTARDRATRRTV